MPASYRKAVEHIAGNDNLGEREPAEAIAGYLTAGLVADLFGKSTETVAADVVKFRDKNWPIKSQTEALVEAAIEPTRKALFEAYREAIETGVETVRAKLAEHDGEFSKAFPYPSFRDDAHTKRTMDSARQFAHRYVEIANPEASSIETRHKIADDVAERIETNAKRDADAAFRAYVAKLTGKIEGERADGEAIVSVEYIGGGSPWMQSTIVAATEGGAQVQKWKTRMILNRSCLGTVFNQWPTRLAK